MRTLPDNLRKLVTEHQQDVRDALRKLRQSDEKQVTIRISDSETYVIKPARPSKPAK